MKVARKSNKMFFLCPCVSSLLDRPWLLNRWHVTRQIKMAKMKQLRGQAMDRNMNGPRNSPCLHPLCACLIYEVQKPSYQSSFCDLRVKGSHVLIYWWSFSTSRVALVVSRLRGFSIMSNAAAFSGVLFFFPLEQTHFSLAAEIQGFLLCNNNKNNVYLPSIKAGTLHFTHP